jgi:hypothetical protein
MFVIWALLEGLLCWQFSRPVFADWIDDNYFDGYRDTPDPPLVAVTLLFGPLLSMFQHPLAWTSSFLTWIWGLAWYLLESDETPTLVKQATSLASSTTSRYLGQTFVPDLDLSMDADEYL